MDSGSVAIGGVILLPLIIGLIQFVKRFDPKDAVDGRVWLASSMAFGVVGQIVVYVIDSGSPTTFAGWAGLVVTGLTFGLAASKAYDGVIRGEKDT